jgi:predicted PurR-regulated permease PerM
MDPGLAMGRPQGRAAPHDLGRRCIVVAVYLAGQLFYRLRDVVLLMVVASFAALVLNPIVVALQKWKVRRRGWTMAIVTIGLC